MSKIQSTNRSVFERIMYIALIARSSTSGPDGGVNAQRMPEKKTSAFLHTSTVWLFLTNMSKFTVVDLLFVSP